VDGFARPVALRAGEVRGGPPVQRRHREDLGGGEAVQVSPAGAGEEVLETVPVIAPERNKVL
jgi:hypothetical protein